MKQRMGSRGNGGRLAILLGVAMFKVGPQAKILTNNSLLAKWNLDGPFEKHEKQLPFLRKQRIIS